MGAIVSEMADRCEKLLVPAAQYNGLAALDPLQPETLIFHRQSERSGVKTHKAV
jgi:hypothetical protein